jgi:hypothetical protein
MILPFDLGVDGTKIQKTIKKFDDNINIENISRSGKNDEIKINYLGG